jgi:hypothetical protein
MMPDFAQRWDDCKRTRFITPEKTFNPRLYEVAPIGEAEAKDFVLRHHYSASYPAARRRFGLFRGGRIVGAAVFSHSMNQRTLVNAFGGAAEESLELGRLVLLDDVEFNGETYLIGYCRRSLRREGFRGIVTFADPNPRTSIDGQLILSGHIGVIYAASQAIYTGLTEPSSIYLLPDGKVLSKRAISKIRNRESGHEYAAQILVSYGADAPPLDCNDERKMWLEQWLKRLTRKMRHNGNHRYLMPLQKGLSLPPSLPYPKHRMCAGKLANTALF